MKKNIHPKYNEVLFVDSATGYRFVCGSSLITKQTEIHEGKEYPVCHLSISSASHPLFTGSRQLVDAEGRVDKFRKRYAAKNAEIKQQQEQNEEEEDKDTKKKPSKNKK